MNWEDSSACTPIKRDFLRAWFAEEQRFFLTGPAVVSMLLDGVRIHEVPVWMIRPLSVAGLQAFVDRLRLALAERAIPHSSP